MPWSTIKPQVKAALETVSDTGQVHDRIRYWRTDKQFQDFFEGTIGGRRQIRGWTITRAAIPSNERYASGGKHRQRHLAVIRGFLVVSDEANSESTFQDLVDAVVEALELVPSLGGAVSSVEPPTVTTIDFREFGGVLCHFCEINLTVVEAVDRTYQ